MNEIGSKINIVDNNLEEVWEKLNTSNIEIIKIWRHYA